MALSYNQLLLEHNIFHRFTYTDINSVGLEAWFSSILPAWLIGVFVGFLIATFLPPLKARLEAYQSGFEASVKEAPVDAGNDAYHPSSTTDNWIVSTKDLAFFQRHLGEGKDGESATAHTGGPWKVMMTKEIPGLVRYVAWRRSLRNGTTEYKSVTISGGVTAKEFMDFYLDDDYRPRWDTLLSHAEVLENVDPTNRKMVVKWRRNFPCNFISEREYVIARCLFRVGKDLFAVTKSVGEDYEHPALDVEESRKVARIDSFYSMWRSRDVANPWDPAAPACETVLLHHDDFKVPEHLARLTIKLGMWGFVRNMTHQVQPFVQARRERCGMYDDDPTAFGLKPLTIEGDASAEGANADGTDAEGGRKSKSRRSKKDAKWAQGLQRAGWMVVGLTVVRLLMLNSGGRGVHSHSCSLEEEDVQHVPHNSFSRRRGGAQHRQGDRLSYMSEMSR